MKDGQKSLKNFWIKLKLFDMNEIKENMEEDFNFDLPKNRSNVIKVIGVGGGGGNAINYMFKQGISGVDFVVCNTDSQALEKSPVPIKIQLGVSLTEGLGAGANPEIGSLAAKESEEEIKALLSNQTKMVFITAGMGGGTGTGAAPIIAQMSKQIDILTVGIVTIPFQFEGRMRSEQAETGIDILRENVDSLIVINNNKLRQVYGNLGFKAGFAKADEVLATAARGIAEVITHHYRQNIDLKDAKTVLSNSGTAIMGSAVAEGADRAEESVVKALDSPLLNDNKINGCKNVLLLIVSGEDEITIDEIGEINDLIQTEAGNNTNIIMGIGEDKNLKKAISVTIIATGFNSDQQHEIVNTEAKKIIHTLEEDQPYVQDLTDQEKKPNNTGIYDSDMGYSSKVYNYKGSIESEKSKFSKISSTEIEKKYDSKDSNFKENDLIKTNQTIKDIETISTQVHQNLNEEVQEKESVNSTEIFDFEVINDLDSSQIEFDFNESIDGSKNNELKNSNLEYDDCDLKNSEIDNRNLDKNTLNDSLDQISETENLDEDTLKIEIKSTQTDESSSNEQFEFDDKNGTPFDNSIEETIKNSNNSSKEELKKFNYSFQKNIKRINEMDKQPAYKRLGYDIDQNADSDKKSSLTLDKDVNDEIQLRSNNSFLHDNVD